MQHITDGFMIAMRILFYGAVIPGISASTRIYPDEDYINCECNTRVRTLENMTIYWGGEDKCIYGT